MGQLAPTAEDEQRVLSALLGLLKRHNDAHTVAGTVNSVIYFASEAQDKRQVRSTLLKLLASQTDGQAAWLLARGVIELDTAPDDKRRARHALLGLLTRDTGAAKSVLLDVIGKLDPTREDKHQVRQALLGVLTRHTNKAEATMAVRELAHFDPTTRDLCTWRTWADSPSFELLAATRQNTPLPEWLKALPWLPSMHNR